MLSASDAPTPVLSPGLLVSLSACVVPVAEPAVNVFVVGVDAVASAWVAASLIFSGCVVSEMTA